MTFDKVTPSRIWAVVFDVICFLITFAAGALFAVKVNEQDMTAALIFIGVAGINFVSMRILQRVTKREDVLYSARTRYFMNCVYQIQGFLDDASYMSHTQFDAYQRDYIQSIVRGVLPLKNKDWNAQLKAWMDNCIIQPARTAGKDSLSYQQFLTAKDQLKGLIENWDAQLAIK